VLYEELTGPQRVRLHRKVAEALARVYRVRAAAA